MSTNNTNDKGTTPTSVQNDLEPSSSNNPVDEHTSDVISSDTVKRGSGSALSNVRRELSEEELNSPGAIRMLIDKLDDYNACQKELKECRENYHQRDTRCAVLEEKLNQNTAFEITYSALLSFGSLLMGLFPSFPENAITKWFILVCGALLFLGGIAAKVITTYISKNK